MQFPVCVANISYIIYSLGIMTEQAEPKMEKQRGRVSEIFQKLMEENPNIADVKGMVKHITDVAEKHIYHAMIGSEEEYLQVYGLTYHEQEHFNYINQLLHSRTTQVLDRIAESKVELKSTIPPPPPPPPQVPSRIIQEVEEVLRNIDLPVSLYKRQDNYWYHDNPRTIQVKQYLKELHDEDRKWKSELKKKRQEILNEKNEMYHKNVEETAKQEQKMKEEEKLRMIKKIEFIKSQVDVRKKTIEEGLDFLKKQGRPLYKKMEKDFYNKVELPTLQEKKKKLSEVRELRKSVDLIQIGQHRQKYEKNKEQHEEVKIINEPMKVSFKSQHYRSLEKSSVRDFQEDSRIKSLYDKRVEYALMIKQNFKPAVDQQKANQIAARIQQMGKRFKRAKRNRKQVKDPDDEDDEDQEEEEEPEPQPQPEEEEDNDQDEDEDDDDFKIHKQRDDQYEPTHQERYKMGLRFLQEARNRRKRNTDRKAIETTAEGDTKNKTFSVKDAKESQSIEASHATIAPSSNDTKRKIQYRNYLHQMSKTNKTIDFIDTSQIKSELTHDNKIKSKTKVQQLQNKIRFVEEKAKQQEELLKHKKVKRTEAIGKKQQLDNAIIDTIKARLALMNN